MSPIVYVLLASKLRNWVIHLLVATVLTPGALVFLCAGFASAQESARGSRHDQTLQPIVAEALKSASQLSDPVERARVYNSIAGVEWQSDAKKEAQRHFDLAHQTLLQQKPGDSDCWDLQALNEARARVGDLEGAERNLSNCGTHPPPSQEQDLILANMSRHETESGLFPSAFTHVMSIRSPDFRNGALSDLAFIAALAGKYDEALGFADKINSISDRVSAYDNIALAFHRHGQPEKADRAVQSAIRSAGEIPRFVKSPQEDAQGASLQPNPYLSAYADIAETFAEFGDFEQAITLTEKYLESENREWTLMRIAFTAAKMGRPDIIRQINPQPSEAILRAQTTAALAEAVARSGDSKTALQVADSGADLAAQATAYIGLARAAFDADNYASAKELSAHATRLAEAMSDHPQRAGLFWQLAHIQLKAGEKADAQQSLSRVYPDDISWRMLGNLAKDHVRAGDIPGALEIAGRARMISKTQILEDIAWEQARLGDDTGALLWIEPLSSPSEKAWALIGVADGILARNFPDSNDE